MKALRQLQIIVLRARPAAQLAKVKPHHITGFAQGLNLARLDVQQRVFVGHGGQLVEGLGHQRVGL